MSGTLTVMPGTLAVMPGVTGHLPLMQTPPPMVPCLCTSISPEHPRKDRHLCLSTPEPTLFLRSLSLSKGRWFDRLTNQTPVIPGNLCVIPGLTGDPYSERNLLIR